MTSTIQYNRPTFFSQKQVRGVFQPNQSILGATSKMLDMEILTDVPCYLPPTLGVYAIIQNIQILLDGKIQDINQTHPQWLSYMLSVLADNQVAKDKMSVLHGTGAVKYDQVSKKLTMQKVKTSTVTQPSYKFEVLLPLMSNLLSQIGIIQQKLEIIINFVPDIRKVLLPVNPDHTITSAVISQPYFSFECLHGGDYKQKDTIEFTSYVGDILTIPAITSPAVGVNQIKGIRTNAFNNKTLLKALVSIVPSSFEAGLPNTDALQIYQNFNKFVSIPQKGQWWNIAYDGNNLLNYRNVENNSFGLSLASMALGASHSACQAHLHTEESALVELENAVLNGWYGYTAVEVNKFITRDLVMQLYREAEDDETYPTLNEQLSLYVTGMVKTAIVKGVKVYL
jgi:hypothetical protein